MSGTSATPTPWSRRLTLHLLGPTLVAVCGALVVVPYLETRVAREREEALAVRLHADAGAAGEILPWTTGVELEEATARLAAALGVRIGVFAADGRLLAEAPRHATSETPAATPPDVQGALASGEGRSIASRDAESHPTLAMAVRRERDGVVRVVAKLSTPGSTSFGTGVVLPDGRIATNCHVIPGDQRVAVLEGGAAVAVERAEGDLAADLCMLRGSGFAAPPARLGDARTLKIGDEVVAKRAKGHFPDTAEIVAAVSAAVKAG